MKRNWVLCATWTCMIVTVFVVLFMLAYLMPAKAGPQPPSRVTTHRLSFDYIGDPSDGLWMYNTAVKKFVPIVDLVNGLNGVNGVIMRRVGTLERQVVALESKVIVLVRKVIALEQAM